MPQHLLAAWPKIQQSLQEAHRVVLLFDYDGTLAPIVDHPELICERITRYARLVGRENVIAGSDCGFSTQASYNPEVHPTIVWAKFQAMAEGARLATEQLWR